MRALIVNAERVWRISSAEIDPDGLLTPYVVIA